MSSRDDSSTAARRLIAIDIGSVVDDIRSTRVELGLSQAELASAARVSIDQVSRIERRLIDRPALDHLAAIASVLGMRLRLNLYPEGEPIRDRVQASGLVSFRTRLHASMAWRSEVSLPGHGDRRAWDAVVIDEDHTWTGIEWISRVGAVDAMLRRANQKQRDDPRVSRVVLVVADTARNRHALRSAIAIVRADYPLDTREVLAALKAGRAPALNGIALMRIPGGHPQRIHNGGNLVDGSAREGLQLVENPVGATFIEP